MRAWLSCERCDRTHPVDEIRYRCDCRGLLDVTHDLKALRGAISRETFDRRGTAGGSEGSSPRDMSGVWRYAELVLPIQDDRIVSRPEGNTPIYSHHRLSDWTGLAHFAMKHEGENPTGSFKDRGMTVGVTQAVHLGARAVACASTGNTSASLASYAALAGVPAVVFIPAGQIAYGKLSQALAYGALTLQVQGDFDDAMRLVQTVCNETDIYLLNSINPFRIEGQKTIIFELLQYRHWVPPDWIVVPAGNLGNTSAFGKALHELQQLGLMDRLPRIASVQAEGANPFYQGYMTGFKELKRVRAKTIASAIKIGSPVSYWRAARSLRWTNGVVTQVSDEEILEAKAQVDAAGIGCEPASAAAVAGTRRLVAEGVIGRDESVVAILTGHLLKDPDTTVAYHTEEAGEGRSKNHANRPIKVQANALAIRQVLEGML